MPRFAALLGSINVGGNRLRMADLVESLRSRGFANVMTVVASGNVLLDANGTGAASIEHQISDAILQDFGIKTFACVRTKDELAAALAENPFAGVGEDKLVHVHFLTDQPDASQFFQLSQDHEGRGPERLSPGTRALHIDYADGVGSSKLTGPFIERRLGCKGTARNVRSINRIIEKFQ